MGWFVGFLAGTLVAAGTWALSLAAPVGHGSEGEWRAGAPPEPGGKAPVPALRPTRAPSEAGQEENDREIRPPVQRGPDDFYRKPPRERKPRDRMYAGELPGAPDLLYRFPPARSAT